MNSAAVIGRQLRQQNRAPGPLAVPGRPRAPSHVNLGPLPASVTAASSPYKDSSANKQQQEEDEKQHSLIPAYVSLGCVWKFAKALSPGVLLIAIGTAMCVVGFLAEQLSTSVVVIDSAANITTTTVDRSMEYHLHNLSFAGPAIMGLGGICIVAACVLTFGVKDHHHRVVPVDEKRPSIGEALVPILPLPPKGRRKPKPPPTESTVGNTGEPSEKARKTSASIIITDVSNPLAKSTTVTTTNRKTETVVSFPQLDRNSQSNLNNRVAEERRKSSAVAGSKTTIVPTKSSDTQRSGVSTTDKRSCKPAAVSRASQPQTTSARATANCSGCPDYPERFLAGSALSATEGDLSSVSGCSTPTPSFPLQQMTSSGVWTCPVGISEYLNNHPHNIHVPGPSGRAHESGQASAYSNDNSVPPSSLNFIPLHTRTGATPPFKMRPAPSLSTSSTCTNFLLSPQYETTFIPSPTDLQILDPDGCDTPSSSKSYFMSRSASASSGLHLDMYLNRLPVSLRMQLSSKLFASMESDGLSSISTSENDIATNDIVLRDFPCGRTSMMKRASLISSCNKIVNSRNTSNEDSQEVTPLLAEDESPATTDSDSLGRGHLGSSQMGCSYDKRFPLLRQSATENSRGINGKLPTAASPVSNFHSDPITDRRSSSANSANSLHHVTS